MSTGPVPRRHGDPIYLYAIVPSEPNRESALVGMETIAEGVSMIEVGRYSAVVGESPGPDLKGRSREVLGRLLIAHQRVIEQLMRTTSVLPVKFGTQMPDEKGLREVLERECPLFDSVFAQLQGCTQSEVLVTWDIYAVFADVAIEEPIARLKAQIADNAEAATTALRVALGKLVKQALDRRRADVATRVSDALRAIAIDAIANPVVADRVVVHLMLLLKTDALGELDRCLDRLDATYGGQLCFRCVGPMPPASFATLEIEFLRGDEIERASRLLGVALPASRDDVRSAYRRLARAAHPDTAERSGNSAGTMAALTDAYKFLVRYARACKADRQNDGSRAIAAPAVLVSIRRQDAESGVGRIAAAG